MSDSGWMETVNFHDWLGNIFVPAVNYMLMQDWPCHPLPRRTQISWNFVTCEACTYTWGYPLCFLHIQPAKGVLATKADMVSDTQTGDHGSMCSVPISCAQNVGILPEHLIRGACMPFQHLSWRYQFPSKKELLYSSIRSICSVDSHPSSKPSCIWCHCIVKSRPSYIWWLSTPVTTHNQNWREKVVRRAWT